MADPVTTARLAHASNFRTHGWFWRFEIGEVWVRFLLAIAGLVLAFGAAVFSTVKRESGGLWATVIPASVALGLAVMVGVTTVPYLARRIVGGRIRDAFDYEVTRVGIIYVITVLLIGIAALNTGNNLLYMIVAAMLAAIVVSGLASAVVLRGLELDVGVPEQVFAGRPARGKIVMRNRRRWLASFSITVTPLKNENPSRQWKWEPTTFGFPPGRLAARQWIRFPDWQLRRLVKNDSPQGIFTESVYFPYLPAGQELAAETELCFRRRGRYQQHGFGLATRFPFAVLTKTRRVPLVRETLVYPAVEPTREAFDALPLMTGEFETFARGRGDDLYRIREYMLQDSARHLDWKATAKSGSLKVREFSREDEPKLRLVFDNPAPGDVSEAGYENAVNLAASVAWHFGEGNTDLSFVAQAYSGGSAIHDFLAYLATVEPKSLPSVLDSLAASDDYNIIFTTRPRGAIPTQLWGCSYFIFIGEQH